MALNVSSDDDVGSSPILMNRVKFGIFLALHIPSLICSLYLILQYITGQVLRPNIHNHILIVLLYNNVIFVAIVLPANEAFFFTSYVRPASDLYCAFWVWSQYSLDVSNLTLMTYACAERHWLLFTVNPLASRRRRLLYHYIPILVCTIYPWLFYFVFIFLYPCESTYDYTQFICFIPCYFFNNAIANFDTYINSFLLVFAIPILSVILLVRFLLQKRRMRMEMFQWKRDRKMIIQLLSTASLYFLMWTPGQAALVYSIIVFGGAAPAFVVDYLLLLPFFVHLLYPFVMLFSNSDLRCRRRAIGPQERQLQQTNGSRTI